MNQETIQTVPTSLAATTRARIMQLIYGGAGVGKSVYAFGSQNMRNFAFDVDQGLQSVVAFKGAQIPDGPFIPPCNPTLSHVWKVTSQVSFDAGLKFLVAHMGDYDHIVVDTATELQRYVIEAACARTSHIIPERQDWNVTLLVLEQLTRMFRGFPQHVTFVAHEIEYEDKETSRRMAQPSFQGQYGDFYAKHFDLILRYQLFDRQVKNGDQISWVTHRYLNCQRDQVIEAKDRFATLAKYELPYIDYIFGKCMQSLQQQ